MFTSVSMTNFRKCRNVEMQFEPGMNVIRGLNEASKSTRFEAMAYAMFGVDALREPLDDVVTWGEKVSSLKVKLNMTVNSNAIEIRRGKSGAEIDVDGKLVATGQKEVTRFVEGLLGAAPKVAAKLMLANQASLRGALSEGPTATAQLIEQLSNFALIDEIIQLVQEKLPSGNAAAAEQVVKSLAEQLESEKPGELDLKAHFAEVADTETALGKEQRELAEAQAELVPAKAAAEAGRAQARGLQAAREGAGKAQTAITRAETALSSLKLASSVGPEELVRLRKWVADTNSAQDAQAAHKAMSAIKPPEQEWEGDVASFDAAVASTNAEAKKLADLLTGIEVEMARVSGRVIKEQACAFCGKDLKDVPEVAILNSSLREESKELQAQYALLTISRMERNEEQHAYAAIAKADRAVREVFARHHPYMSMSYSSVPAKLEWLGPDLSQAVQGGAVQALRTAEAEVQRAAQDVGKQATLQAELARAQAELAESQRWIADLAPKVAADKSLALETDLGTKVRYHEGRISTLTGEIRSLKQTIEGLKQLHALKIQTYTRLQASYQQALTTLEELQLNNVLLKKLRAARPRVADKLWGTVLATVSYYFSAIRGVQSVVTRDESGFRVDGKPVPGLSGSTLDALGLAIRIALTKTFLPNNDFLILDEPAAACDDERESNMLGTVTTAGFAQVLLVTHSQLADAFAEKVITL